MLIGFATLLTIAASLFAATEYELRRVEKRLRNQRRPTRSRRGRRQRWDI